ncbi:Trehalose-6-P synthase/phosphatase complex synthase subunit [Mucor velutinosus]|uniref:Trehalose-6-P synthase/phosphatase complex synthase subunit n=1 Tax=Mucor velutinosus TaxID=708070 RepID=A0AAN7DR97_9FUNG|nr:Trehalose-6-P synthase/phosphatase complex synthase subunit [Mucor velutinosus]
MATLSTVPSATSESTVLASSAPFDSHRWTNAGRPKIIEFYGFEGEDFRHFLQLMESFFALKGITQDPRKVAIMRAQLRRVAAIFFDNTLKERNLALNKISFTDATTILQERFVSESIIECYQSTFDEMCQSPKESPSEFLSRLYKAADLANIHDEKFISARYRAGLCKEIKIFCKEMSAINFQDWVKHSNAWWNAHSVKAIHFVDNPFSVDRASGFFNGDNGKKLALNKVNNEKALSSKSVCINPIPTSAAEAYANSVSPTIANITSRMEALELHSLIPSTDKEGQFERNTIRDRAVKSLITDKEFKSFLKNIIQEANDEKVMTRKPYRNNHRNSDGYHSTDTYCHEPSFDLVPGSRTVQSKCYDYVMLIKENRLDDKYPDHYASYYPRAKFQRAVQHANNNHSYTPEGNQRYDGPSYGNQRRGGYNQQAPPRNYNSNSYNQDGQSYGNNYGDSRNQRDHTYNNDNFGGGEVNPAHNNSIQTNGHYNGKYNGNSYYNKSYNNHEYHRYRPKNHHDPHPNYNDFDDHINTRKKCNGQVKRTKSGNC